MNLHPPLFNLVGYVKLSNVEVMGTLAGRKFHVNLEPLSRFTILVETSGACVTLDFDEKVGSYHAGHDVVYSDELGLCQATCVYFCSLQKSRMENFPVTACHRCGF